MVWHIVAKDMRRLWLPVLLWVLVVLARNETGVTLLRGDGADFNTFDLLHSCNGFLLGLDTFIHVVLAVVLVQGDATVGTKGFWITRPMSGLRLLGAKLLGALLVFGLLPVLLSLRWWLVCGYDAGEIAHAALLTLDGQMALTLGVMVLAALTENVKQFLAAALGALAAVGAMFAWQFWADDIIGQSGRVAQTAATVSNSLLVVGLASVLVHQFRTRRTRQSLALIGTSFAAATVVLPLWRWNWSRFEFGTTRPEAAGISVEVDSASGKLPPSPYWRELTIHYLIRGLPEEVTLKGGVVGTLRWPDGTTAARPQPLATRSRYGAERQALQLAGTPVGAAPSDPQRFGVMLLLPERDVIRLRTEKASFSSDLTLNLFRPVQELVLPLSPGAAVENNGYTLRVTTVRNSDGVAHFRLVESSPLDERGVHGRPGFIRFLGGPTPTRTELAYRLVNRTNQEVMEVQPGSMQTIVGTQVVRWSSLTLESPERFEGATLRLLRYEPISRIQRSAAAETLPITFSKQPE